MINTVLNNRYRIVSELGDGGMATVYLAVDGTLHREVAVKILHPHLAKDGDLSNRFYQEASIAAGLDHPNVMKIFDYGKHSDGRAYIVAEFLKGQDFYKLQTDRFKQAGETLPALFSALVAAEVLKGLAFAHSMHIVHRDVKPDNVMVTEQGIVKLMDFGIAKNTARQLTLTGHFLGSPSYSSPEQIRGTDLDGRTDLYSVGVILYEALTNRLPFYGNSAPEVMLKICQGSTTRLAQFAGRVANGREIIPIELANIVDKAMSLEVSQRYRTAEAMLEHIKIFLREFGVADSASAIFEFISSEPTFLKTYVREKSRSILVSNGLVGNRGAKKEATTPFAEKPHQLVPRGGNTATVALSPAQQRSRGLRRTHVGRDQQTGILQPLLPDLRDPREIAGEMREQRDRFSSTQKRERFSSTQKRLRQTQRHPKLSRIAHLRFSAPSLPARVQTRRSNLFLPRISRTAEAREGGFPGLFVVLIASAVLFLLFLAFYSGGNKVTSKEVSRRERSSANRPPVNENTSSRKVASQGRKNEGRKEKTRENESDSNSNRTRSLTPQNSGGVPQISGSSPQTSGASSARRLGSATTEDQKPTPAKNPTDATRRQLQEQSLPKEAKASAAELKAAEAKVAEQDAAKEAEAEAKAAAKTVEAKTVESKTTSTTGAPSGVLTLQTIPGEVPIFLNRKFVGKSDPAGGTKSIVIPPGPYLLQIPKVTISGTHFLAHSQRVFVNKGGKATSLGVLNLRALRKITIFIAGPGVIVRVNNDPYVIKNRPVVLNLPEGTVDIHAKASNGKQFRRTIELKGEDISLNTTLE